MKKTAVFFAVLILVAGLGYGIIRLFTIRFAQGDVYPAYSTLRADDVGSEALYESLGELMPVERNERPLSDLDSKGNAAIFLLGMHGGFEENSDADDLEKLAREGNRVVLAFFPYEEKLYAFEQSSPSPTPTATATPTASPKTSGTHHSREETDEEKMADVRKAWGVKTAFSDTKFDRAKTGIAGLEPELSWHSAMYFDKPGTAWSVIYSAAGKPVIIERSFGGGSIVLVADSYFSSDEALNKERATGLIAYLVGDKGKVIFDETHLGVVENPGVVSLMRRFRLEGVILALVVVAALFLWRSAVAFIPRRADEVADEEIIRGFDASTAFVSLLRRNITRDKLIATCVAEWKRSFGHRAKPALVGNIEAAATGGARNPAETFGVITQILSEKK